MPFQVFQDDKACSAYNFGGQWNKDTFETKREAEIFAYWWAYPMPYAKCKRRARRMTVGKNYDYGVTKTPVMMKIMEIKKVQYKRNKIPFIFHIKYCLNSIKRILTK